MFIHKIGMRIRDLFRNFVRFWPKLSKISGKLAKFSENWPKLSKISGKIPEFCVKWGPPGSKMTSGFLSPKFTDLLAYVDYFTVKIGDFLGSF